jgi:hypothetical protein
LGQKAAICSYVTRPTSNTFEGAIPAAFVSSISSFQQKKARSSGDFSTHSSGTNSTAPTLLMELLRLSFPIV